MIVKVQLYSGGFQETGGREYTYYSEDALQVGDMVIVPVRDTVGKAKVSAIDVPEAEIAAFKDKVKIIPAGSILPTIPETKLSDDWKSFKPLGTFNENKEHGFPQVGPGWREPGEPLTTATIMIAPERDMAILSLLTEANRLRDIAEKRIIINDTDLESATDDMAVCARVKKALTEKQAEYIKPIKAHQDAVRARFFDLLAPIEAADSINRTKWSAYRNEQARRKAETDAINQKRQAEADAINRDKDALAKREAELNHGEITVDLTPVLAPAPIIAPLPISRVRTEMGSAGVTHNWKGEVVDFKLLPDEYKCVDYAKLGKVIRAGLRTIPGVRIWDEEGLRVSPR